MKHASPLLYAVVPLLLLACDDGGSGGPSKEDQTPSTYDQLPACTESLEGEVAYVEGVAYVCESGDWTPGEPGSSATQGSSGSNGGGKSSGGGNSSSSNGGEPEIPCADIWCGARGDTALALPNLVADTGYWYSITDAADGGASTIEFAEGGISASILANGKISFSYSLAQGESVNLPNVVLAITLGNTSSVEAYIDPWGGVCLTYSASAPFQVQVIPTGGIITDYDYHAATVDSSTAVTSVDLPWSAFEQAGWGTPVDRADVLVSASKIQLVFYGADGDSGEVSLLEVGTPGSCGKSP